MKIRTFRVRREQWAHVADGFVIELGGAEYEVREVPVEARGEVALQITVTPRLKLKQARAELKVAPLASNAARIEVHYDNDEAEA